MLIYIERENVAEEEEKVAGRQRAEEGVLRECVQHARRSEEIWLKEWLKRYRMKRERAVRNAYRKGARSVFKRRARERQGANRYKR